MTAWPEIIVTAFATAFATGGIAKFAFGAQLRKLNADTNRIEVETDILTSNQLIKELNVLSEVNRSLSDRVDGQRKEIDDLRIRILDYAQRELAHVAEERSLRLRVQELQDALSAKPMAGELINSFPVIIPHTPGEFDDADPGSRQPDSGRP